MGSIEKQVRMTRRKKAVLDVIKASGLISIALVAPQAIKLLKKSGMIKPTRYNPAYSYFRTLKELETQGYISIIENKGKRVVSLSEKGICQLDQYSIGKRKKWDRKWRVLIFDIPESRRGTREKIRNTLRSIGFYRIQDSVWVLPYDCEDLITLLKTDLKIGKELLYMVVDTIEGDTGLRDFFHLPKQY